MKRRKPDDIEIQQMKAQAREDKLNKQVRVTVSFAAIFVCTCSLFCARSQPVVSCLNEFPGEIKLN